MTTFAVPAEYQQKVLTIDNCSRWSCARSSSRSVWRSSRRLVHVPVFGLLLIATAVQLFRPPDQDPSIEDNAIVAVARPLRTSLTVIVAILAVTTIASVINARQDPTARAHAGSLRDRPAEDGES
jgi:hypothetical protein